MNKMIFAALAGVAVVVATGCVNTVESTHAFAVSWNTDTVSGRYNRPMDEVYNASIAVIQHNGVILNEFIPHDTTNTVRSLEGRVNDKNVWVRVEGIDAQISQVDVQARSTWGTTDVGLVHELEKEIALQLASH
jgi:hypothetical protein